MEKGNSMTKNTLLNVTPSYFWTGTYDGDEYSTHNESITGNSTVVKPFDKNFVTNVEVNKHKHKNLTQSELTAIKLRLNDDISKSPQEKMALNIALYMLNKTDKKMILNEISDKIFPKDESVNHPSHYNSDVFPEVIEMMLTMFDKSEVLAFCKLNAFKYRMRCGLKDSEKVQEDINKAIWYENKYREINQSETSEKQILFD